MNVLGCACLSNRASFHEGWFAIFAELEEKQCWLTEIYFSHFFLKSLSFSQCQLIVLWQLIWNCYLRTSITNIQTITSQFLQFLDFCISQSMYFAFSPGYQVLRLFTGSPPHSTHPYLPTVGPFHRAHWALKQSIFFHTHRDKYTHKHTQGIYEHQP